MLKSTLSAQETPVYKVFCDDYLFRVPSVQRPYSWTDHEAGELLDDLLEFIEQHGIQVQNINHVPEPYFLGSIVLVKADKPDCEILDGQQRLTTLTILLAALRSYLPDPYDQEIDALIVQKGSKIRNIQDTYRLELRKKDNEFFRKYIQEASGISKLSTQTKTYTDSQSLIRDNALFFLDRLSKLDVDKLKTLSSVIATLCYIVVVSTPNFDSAFRIFTVLNDRGLDLMLSDILKARIIGDIPEPEQELYTEKWEDVESTLGREHFNALFSHIRMILQKRKGTGSLKDEYEDIFKSITGKNFIDEILLPYSETYHQIIDYKSKGFPQDIENILEFLNRIDNVDWIPLGMYILHSYGNSYKTLLQKLERFAAVQMILRKNFNWRQHRYAIIFKDLTSKKASLDSLLDLNPQEKNDIISILNDDVYTKVSDKPKRYLLLRLDAILSQGQPRYNYETLTIEHVLPQKPASNSQWLSLFPDPELYVNKLGNLVLLTRKKNSQAKNFDFPTKKTSYFQSKNGVSTFALTSQVINEDIWTPAVVTKRQKQLVDLLIQEWDLK